MTSTIERIERRNPSLNGVRLIALSGYGQAEDQQQAREAGFDHHFVKPISEEALRTILAEVAAAQNH